MRTANYIAPLLVASIVASQALAAPNEHNETQDVDRSGYHFTRQATYLFTDFLGDDEATTLGLETDAKFEMGSLSARHIMYLEVMDYPRAIPGKMGTPEEGDPESFEAATGIGDLLTGIWFTPVDHHGTVEFGPGAALQVPTASDDALGSGQWATGPSIDIEYRNGKFFAGTIIMQLWSFAGDSSRKDVNMIMAKYFLMYDMNEKWKAISIPYGVSYCWNKPSGERLALPVGGGLQRNFTIGKQRMSLHAQYFHYVERPTKGSEADARLTLEMYW